MIIKKFKINDDSLLKKLKDEIDIAIKQKKIYKQSYVISSGMTTFHYFIDDRGKEVFDIFKKKYLSEYSINECWGVRYKKGEKSLKHDHLRLNNGLRPDGAGEISGVMYLNDSETGLYFDDLDIVEKAEKGKVIIFTSDTFHSVPEIKEDDRYVISFNGFKKIKYDRYR